MTDNNNAHERITEDTRKRIADVWRYRVALLGHPRPTAEDVAWIAGATVAEVRKVLGGLPAGCEATEGVQS